MTLKHKKIILIIPVRMGSKRLKNKNILPINKMPMFVYVAKEAVKSKFKIKFVLAHVYSIIAGANPKQIMSDKLS